MKSELQEIILLIAELYKEPKEDLFKAIQSGQFANLWDQQQKLLNNLDERTKFQHPFTSFSEMKSIYYNCFVGPNEPFAPPIESLYKKWTSDESAQSLIANEVGYLYGDAAIHLNYLYEQYGLTVPDYFKNMPDHLCLQLEFLAFLIENDFTNVLSQYIDDHFDWLDKLNDKLRTINNSEFYLWLTDQLIKITRIIKISEEKYNRLAEGE